MTAFSFCRSKGSSLQPTASDHQPSLWSPASATWMSWSLSVSTNQLMIDSDLVWRSWWWRTGKPMLRRVIGKSRFRNLILVPPLRLARLVLSETLLVRVGWYFGLIREKELTKCRREPGCWNSLDWLKMDFLSLVGMQGAQLNAGSSVIPYDTGDQFGNGWIQF